MTANQSGNTPAATSNPALKVLLVIAGVLVIGGVFIAISAGTSAAKSQRSGEYEVALGGYGSYLQLAQTQYMWMWIGVVAAAVGGLAAIGLLFLQASKRK